MQLSTEGRAIDTATIVAIIGALGGGGVIAAVVNSVLGRKKESAEIVKAQTDTLSTSIETSAKTIITMYREDNASLRDQLDQIESKLDHARQETSQLRAEVAQLRPLGELIAREREWAINNGHTTAPVLHSIAG